MTAARLRGDLATATDHQAAAAAAFETAWRRAPGLRVPLALAQLEISMPPAARRRPTADGPPPGCVRPDSASPPWAPGPTCKPATVSSPPSGAPGTNRARHAPPDQGRTGGGPPVAAGHSNRQTAAELYVSVKTVEFHLGHIFDKFGIRSRRDLITRIGAPSP